MVSPEGPQGLWTSVIAQWLHLTFINTWGWCKGRFVCRTLILCNIACLFHSALLLDGKGQLIFESLHSCGPETHKENKRKRTQKTLPLQQMLTFQLCCCSTLSPETYQDLVPHFLFVQLMFRTILVLFHSSIIIEMLLSTVTWCYKQNHLRYATAELQVCGSATKVLQRNFCFWCLISDRHLCPTIFCSTCRLKKEECFTLTCRVWQYSIPQLMAA